MIELEILVEVFDNIEKAKNILNKFEFITTQNIIDTYYYSSFNDELKPDSKGRLLKCLRIRNKGNEYFLTYKDDKYNNDIWLYSDEYECRVDNLSNLKNIFKNLGYNELIILNSKKTFYRKQDYEIVLEQVENLGTFLEVELKKQIKTEEIEIEKNNIRSFIESLSINISDELNCGKPQLYLQRHKR